MQGLGGEGEVQREVGEGEVRGAQGRQGLERRDIVQNANLSELMKFGASGQQIGGWCWESAIRG
eukprot:1723494-Lingulodinium_polyedra.AAC.1